MPFLIDGHNLIPKIPGLSLQALDDENHLIALLQDFCRLQRKQVDVYFDNASPGMAGSRRFGVVTAHFVPQGSDADTAIRKRLSRLGKSAPNWTVVSSDASVQAEARAVGAKVISSDEFVRLLFRSGGDTVVRDQKSEIQMTPEEINEWIRLFQQRK
jgi:hypothetical protein